MTLAEVEDYRLAKGKLVPFGVSLLSAVEEWIAGRGKTPRIITKTAAEVAEEFLTSKRVEGVGFFHLEDRKYRMNKFAASFPGRIDQLSAGCRTKKIKAVRMRYFLSFQLPSVLDIL